LTGSLHSSQKTIVIDNVAYQVADIITQTEADIAASDAADKGHADWITLVDKERASHEAVDPILSGVEKIVRVQFGNAEGAQSVLGDFGLTPHKKAVLSPEAKVARARKAKATRKLLHTAGPKQKAEVKKQASQPGAPAEGTASGSATPPAKQ
jgi:hypothetical protein